MSIDQIAGLIAAHRYTWRDERDLQDCIAAVLTAAELTVDREVVLAPECRIDLLVGRVGIEVKVKGTAEAVLRQLQRYAHSDLIDRLVLATTKRAHTALPAMVSGVPLTIVYVTHLA